MKEIAAKRRKDRSGKKGAGRAKQTQAVRDKQAERELWQQILSGLVWSG